MSCPLPCPLPYQLVHLSGRRAPAESLCHQKWNPLSTWPAAIMMKEFSGQDIFLQTLTNFCHRVLPLSNTPLGPNLFIKGLSLASDKEYYIGFSNEIYIHPINIHLSQFSFGNNWVRTRVEEQKKDEHYEVESQQPSKSINAVHYL